MAILRCSKETSIGTKIIIFFNSIKWFFQRVFRSYHASDCDLWNLSDHLAGIILPKLKAFRKMPLHGYPCTFSNEDKENLIPAGEIGGGMEKWFEYIDQMIFAMEFIVVDSASDNSKIVKEFKKKYGDWEAEVESNKKTTKYDSCEYYYNDEMYKEFRQRAQKGLEIFGKYFWSLWD